TIVVLTIGLERMKRSAISGKLILGGKTALSFSTRGMVFERFSGPKYLERQSSAGNFVSKVIFPPRLPSSSGTRAITPMFNFLQAGNSSSSGDWSKML